MPLTGVKPVQTAEQIGSVPILSTMFGMITSGTSATPYTQLPWQQAIEAHCITTLGSLNYETPTACYWVTLYCLGRCMLSNLSMRDRLLMCTGQAQHCRSSCML
jgi:hypothetical protein